MQRVRHLGDHGHLDILAYLPRLPRLFLGQQTSGGGIGAQQQHRSLEPQQQARVE